jgi:hypothetical protein
MRIHVGHILLNPQWCRTLKNVAALSIAAVLAMSFVLPLAHVQAIPNTFQTCDIFVGVGGGQINWFRPNTCPGVPSSVTLQATLQATGFSDTYIAGMSFDVNGGCATIGQPCLYATTFGANTIAVFDVTGAYIGTCGALGGADPRGISDIESAIVVPGFSTGPSIFFGQADGDRNVLQYPLPCNSSSTPIAMFAPCTSGSCAGTGRGTDFVDMTTNLCDLHYTSESTGILDFNVCTNTQGTALTTSLPGSAAYAHKSLSDGSVIVADSGAAVHVSNTGTVINSCDQTGGGALFSMDILPDQKSFAMANLAGAGTLVDYLTVAHCDAGQTTADFSFVGLPTTQTGCGACLIAGVAIFGEFTPQPTLTTSLSPTSISIGGSASDQATLSNLNSPSGTITFHVSNVNQCPSNSTSVGSPVTVSGNGVYDSISKTFTTAGTYYWYAAYSGDDDNRPLVSACEPLTVGRITVVPEFGAPVVLLAAIGMLGVALMSRRFRVQPAIQA